MPTSRCNEWNMPSVKGVCRGFIRSTSRVSRAARGKFASLGGAIDEGSRSRDMLCEELKHLEDS